MPPFADIMLAFCQITEKGRYRTGRCNNCHPAVPGVGVVAALSPSTGLLAERPLQEAQAAAKQNQVIE